MIKLKKFFLTSLIFLAVVLVITNTVFCAEGNEAGGHGVNVLKELFRWINFIILASVIYKFLSKPAKEFLSARIESIKKMLTESKEALMSADKKLKESQSLLNRSEKEIEEINKNARIAMELEKEKIAKETEKINERIKEQADSEAAQLYKKAEIYISNELIIEATKIAEETLKKEFTKENQSVLVKKYISALGEIK